MTIEKNKVASIDYVLTSDDGEVIDASAGHGPLEYLHGNGNLIPGLERELEGKKAGDKLKAVIAPKAADAINARKLSGQQVQAAYLGQTDRFSGTTPEKNQIVEIWHILPPAPSE